MKACKQCHLIVEEGGDMPPLQGRPIEEWQGYPSSSIRAGPTSPGR